MWFGKAIRLLKIESAFSSDLCVSHQIKSDVCSTIVCLTSIDLLYDKVKYFLNVYKMK